MLTLHVIGLVVLGLIIVGLFIALNRKSKISSLNENKAIMANQDLENIQKAYTDLSEKYERVKKEYGLLESELIASKDTSNGHHEAYIKAHNDKTDLLEKLSQAEKERDYFKEQYNQISRYTEKEEAPILITPKEDSKATVKRKPKPRARKKQ